jgi:hypothetical protein
MGRPTRTDTPAWTQQQPIPQHPGASETPPGQRTHTTTGTPQPARRQVRLDGIRIVLYHEHDALLASPPGSSRVPEQGQREGPVAYRDIPTLSPQLTPSNSASSHSMTQDRPYITIQSVPQQWLGDESFPVDPECSCGPSGDAFGFHRRGCDRTLEPFIDNETLALGRISSL